MLLHEYSKNEKSHAPVSVGRINLRPLLFLFHLTYYTAAGYGRLVAYKFWINNSPRCQPKTFAPDEATKLHTQFSFQNKNIANIILRYNFVFIGIYFKDVKFQDLTIDKLLHLALIILLNYTTDQKKNRHRSNSQLGEHLSY